MAAINVRRLDDEVARRFKRRARANDRSLEAEVRHALARAVRTGASAEIRERFLADVKALRSGPPGRAGRPGGDPGAPEARPRPPETPAAHAVVDASVAMKWLAEEEDSAPAERLLRDGIRLHAPHLLKAEVADALGAQVGREALDPGAAAALYRSFLELDIEWEADRQIDEQTLLLAMLSKRSARDFAYFLLAAHLDCPLVTADRNFASALEDLGFAGPFGLVAPLGDSGAAATWGLTAGPDGRTDRSFRVPMDRATAAHFECRAAASGRTLEQEVKAYLAAVMRFDQADDSDKMHVAADGLGAAVKDGFGAFQGVHYIRWDRDYVH